MKNQSSFKGTGIYLLVTFFVLINGELSAQSATKKRHVLIDIAHGQKFWNDPSAMAGMDAALIDRVKYMTGEITKTAASVNADIGYVKSQLKRGDLANCDLLFIHIPSLAYGPDEAAVIKDYLQKGGALFVAMDADYWSTPEQTHINELITLSGITFGANSPDTVSGGYTKPGQITGKKLKITYHGGRYVNGGTPFCYNDQTAAYPFGTFTTIPKGGKIVAMGDGMTSLYMTSWAGVTDYQCSEFMHDVFAWLLKK